MRIAWLIASVPVLAAGMYMLTFGVVGMLTVRNFPKLGGKCTRAQARLFSTITLVSSGVLLSLWCWMVK